MVGTRTGLTTLVVAAIAASCIILGAGSASAGGRPPLGYQLMCLQTPAECKGSGKARVAVTADIMATLKRVNAHYNRTIEPRYDRKGADVWTVGASAGDCEDYVLAKRRALVKAGLPASALRIAYVKTRKGEDHAILVVKTNGKDLVLDNLTAAIRPLGQTGYRVVSMSGANPRQWS